MFNDQKGLKKKTKYIMGYIGEKSIGDGHIFSKHIILLTLIFKLDMLTSSIFSKISSIRVYR